MNAKIILFMIIAALLLVGVAGCEKETLDNNSKLNETSWKLTGYVNHEEIFEPLVMPEQWKDTSYQVIFKKDRMSGTMPNGSLHYGKYQALKNGKWNFSEQFEMEDISYGSLSNRFREVLHYIHSYELSGNELKFNSFEMNSNTTEKQKITMILKR